MGDLLAANAFLAALAELRAGAVLVELDAAVQSLVGNVRAIGKPGELVIKLKITMAKGSTATVIVTDEIRTVDPKAEKEITVMYADEGNRLSRRDPRQPQLSGLAMPGEVRAFGRPPVAVEAIGGHE